MQIPKAKQVDESIERVADSAQAALQSLNQKAGILTAKGKYGEAEALTSKGREIQAFIAEVWVLGGRWRAVCSLGSGTSV